MKTRNEREELNYAYSPSSVARDYRGTIKNYAARSDDVLRNHKASNLSFGNSSQEYLLLFEPDSVKWNSMLLFIHGGYWQELSAEESCFMAEAWLGRGIAYAALNYVLAPEASVAEIVQQCVAALKMLRSTHPDARIVIAGSSAGAQLAAMLMSIDWRAHGLDAVPFQGAVLISGIYDLRPLVSTYINEPLKLDIETAESLSPLLLAPVAHVPVVICYGEHETDAFKTQSEGYLAHLSSFGAEARGYEVEGRDHFDILFDLCQPVSRVFNDTLSLIGE